MASENTTVVLGIPIPSTDPAFLSIVGIHVLFGIAAVVAGAVAMLSRKGRGRHSNWGTIYYWCLAGVFVTMAALSFMRWTGNQHLFILGTLSFGSAHLARLAARRHRRQWVRLHLAGMGASYIFMLTAFYVDNGKNLPVWRELPQLAFWLLPGAIGLPLILYALLRHPVVLAFDRSRAGLLRSQNLRLSRQASAWKARYAPFRLAHPAAAVTATAAVATALPCRIRPRQMSLTSAAS